MTEPAKKHPAKTYSSKLLSFSCAWTDDETKKKSTIHFVNGIFTTDDKAKQEHIEGLDGFGRFITIAPEAPSPREILKTAAAKTAAEAKKAADALAAYDKENAPKQDATKEKAAA